MPFEPPPPLALSRPQSCLVMGGARSGKSGYAQRLAEGSGRALVYLATATTWDREMRERVARHRDERDARWRTIEEPLALAETLEREADPGSVILVDCLTLWLTNLMLGGHSHEDAAARLIEAVPRVRGSVIFVSNEVGWGIVPDTPLGRRFRDAQGWLNQAVAACCDTVVLVAAGLPVLLKPAATPLIPI